MPVPWLRILDAVIGVTDLARSRRIRQLNPANPAGAAGPRGGGQEVLPIDAGNRALGGLEARLAGVIVAALKEVFERDARRLELERQQLEAERAHAERALRLELARQAGDREVGQLRLVALVGVGSWFAAMFVATRVLAHSIRGLTLIGGAWLLLLAGSVAAFAGQSRVSRALARMGDEVGPPRGTISSGSAGALAPWLVLAGLVLVGLAVFIAQWPVS